MLTFMIQASYNATKAVFLRQFLPGNLPCLH